MEIIRYMVSELGNPTAAADFMDQLRKRIEEVRLFPESGSMAGNDLVPDLGIRKKVVGNYVMYDQPELSEDKVTILRIIHSKRNAEEIRRTLSI